MTRKAKPQEQEPTTKNCESCRYYGSHHEVCNYCYKCSLWTDQEPTTKNDLSSGTRKNSKKLEKNIGELDCISRQAVLEQAYAYGNGLEPDGYCVNVEDIQALPSVTPQEPILDKIFCIAHPLSIMSTPELEHKAIMQITEMLEPLCLPEGEDE